MKDTILHEGEVILPSVLTESGTEELHCDPPVRFRYAVYDSNHYNAIIEFDFGLQFNININPRLTFNSRFIKESEKQPEQLITTHVLFELFHSFCHPEFDPNYSHLNWAIKGWLKDRVTVKELPLT